MPSSSCATTFSHLAFSFKVSLILSFFLGWLADKLHQLRLGIVAVAAYALWAGAYALTPAAFAQFSSAAGLLNALLFALLAFAGLLVVHRYFMRLGGPKNYTAP